MNGYGYGYGNGAHPENIMVTYSKYGTASYNIKVLINNTIANSGMTETGFHTVTISRKLHIPWLKITK